MGFDAGAGYTCAVDWWALGVPTSDLTGFECKHDRLKLHFFAYHIILIFTIEYITLKSVIWYQIVLHHSIILLVLICCLAFGGYSN